MEGGGERRGIPGGLALWRAGRGFSVRTPLMNEALRIDQTRAGEMAQPLKGRLTTKNIREAEEEKVMLSVFYSDENHV